MKIKPTALFISLVAVVTLLLQACSKESEPAAGNVDHYTCSMHPTVSSQDPKGKCPICGMNLVPVPKKPGTNAPAAEP